MQLSTLFRSQGEGGNPLARREAGETTPPRGCSCFRPIAAVMLLEALECPQGSLLPLGLQAPSFIHKTTHSKALVLDRRQSTHARRFPTASHVALLRDGVVDRELPNCDAPERERSSLSRGILRRTRSKTPRWDVPREPSALEQYSLSERRHSGASL